MDELIASNKNINFKSIYNWILNYQPFSRERDWKASALNVLYKVTTGSTGEVLNSDRTIEIEKLTEKQVVLEIGSVGSQQDKSFFVQTLLLRIYRHFLKLGSSKDLRFSIVLEEAHNLLLKHKIGYESVTELVLRQIRELGVGCIIADQHPHLMTLPAIANYATICMNLKTEEDVRTMANAMLLDKERDYIGRLPVGWGIIKLQDRFLKPFLVRFPECKMGDGKVPSSLSDFTDFSLKTAGAAGNTGIWHRDKLSRREKVFLTDIFKHPESYVIERYKRLEVNPRAGNQCLKDLEERGFIKPVYVRVKRGKVKLFDLTALGREYLKKLGYRASNRSGGAEHKFWQRKVMEHYIAKGYKVYPEYSVGAGKKVDVVAVKDGRKIAIEIETGKSDAVSNIVKCVKAGFEQVISVAVSKRLKEDIEKSLKGKIVDKVKVVCLKRIDL